MCDTGVCLFKECLIFKFPNVKYREIKVVAEEVGWVLECVKK